MPERKPIPKAVREKVEKEFSECCAICGKPQKHLHHINEDRSDNDPLNLIPLCPNHHDDQHNPVKKIDPEILAFYREHKIRQILSPQFASIYRRLKPILSFSEPEDMSGKFKEVSELCKFIKHLEMGEYFANQIENLVSPIMVFKSSDGTPIPPVIKNEQRYAANYSANLEKVIT